MFKLDGHISGKSVPLAMMFRSLCKYVNEYFDMNG